MNAVANSVLTSKAQSKSFGKSKRDLSVEAIFLARVDGAHTQAGQCIWLPCKRARGFSKRPTFPSRIVCMYSVWARPIGPGCGGMVRALRLLRFAARPSVQTPRGGVRSPDGPAIPRARSSSFCRFAPHVHAWCRPAPTPRKAGPLFGSVGLVPALRPYLRPRPGRPQTHVM